MGDDAHDDTAALRAFLRTCVVRGCIAHLPDRYVVSGPLVCGGGTGGQVRILGNVGHSHIRSTSPEEDLLVIGNGAETTEEQVNGWIDGLVLYGPHTDGPAPQNGQTALVLDKMSEFVVRNVITRHSDIGLELRHNCYGTSVRDSHFGFGNSHNVGVNLPSSPDTGAGNQIFFYNCWLEGAVAAVHMSPGGDGYAFFGGGMTAARGASPAPEDHGAFVMGRDYRTGVTGGMGNVSLYAVDFEQVGAWMLRAFGPLNMSARDCSFLANGTVPAIGIMKHESAEHSQLLFKGCTVAGEYSSSTALQVTGDGSRYFLEESGWRESGASPRFAETQVDEFPGLLASSTVRGSGMSVERRAGETRLSFGGSTMRVLGGALQLSEDGVRWRPAATEADGALHLGNTAEPDTPSEGGVLYVEGGTLKYKGEHGTVTTLGPA